MLYVLLIMSSVLSWLALRERIFLLGLLAGGAWFITMAYVATYPPGSLTQGDTIHNMLVLILAGAAVSVPVITIRIARSQTYHISASGEEGEPMQHVATISDKKSSRHGWGGSFAEDEDEYKARVHSILHPRRRRR